MENKTGSSAEASAKAGKYFKYAIGEIVLVVIGILIALQINTWNESRQLTKKQTKLFQNLINDIDKDIQGFTRQDSAYAVYEANSDKGLELFYKAKTVEDIDSVMQLSQTSWGELFVNRRTYNEMINSGSMYALENEDLQKNITAYYVSLDGNERYIREVNTSQRVLWSESSDFYPVLQLLSEFNNPRIGIKRLDTTWINNPNASTYLALNHYLNISQSDSNKYRRKVFSRLLKKAEELKLELKKELEDKR